MFKNPFSFEGRIRRTEFGISLAIYVFSSIVINAMLESKTDGMPVFGLAYIPLVWFIWAQAAKRCHDISRSGWWQLVPFYVFVLVFSEGVYHENEYGFNPKAFDEEQSALYDSPVLMEKPDNNASI
ncbi:MAG: DUF805 domain-containing protein [Mucilaginibacter polytrichastri]|nr:DUF805 domain-containing protein [Mucilaginibacter polytrichastri]